MRFNVKIEEVCNYTLNNIEAANADEAEKIAIDLYNSYSPDDMYINNITIESTNSREILSSKTSFKKYVCLESFVGGISPRLKFLPGDVVMYIGFNGNQHTVKYNGSEYTLKESDLDYFAPLNDLSEVE